MKVLAVRSLDGVKPQFQKDVYEAMLPCTNRERLLVCLYFMSELPTSELNNSNIEANLRKIFPPSKKGEGKLPDEYVNFQASAVRHYFDKEVMNGVDPDDRLWENIGHGYWRNTELGNDRAIQILRRCGIRVDHQGPEVVPDTRPIAAEPVSAGDDEKTGEGDVSQIEESARIETAGDVLVQQPGAESLLAYIDILLSCVPDIAPEQLLEPDGTSLSIEGSAPEVHGVVRSMVGFAHPGQISLKLTVNRDGWHVALAAN